MPAGYSGTPLARKLGFKSGQTIRLIDEPAHYFELFTDLPEDLRRTDNPRVRKDLIHYFTTEAEELARRLPKLRRELRSAGMIWISWPKKASKVPTDITEDVVRALALSHGVVDVKVCAVDETWSGLKLVIPVALRKNGSR